MLTVSFAAMISLTVLTNCSSPANKVESATEDVNEANEDLEKANQEYVAEIAQYRKETALQIEKNDLKIAELKTKNEKEKRKNREETAKLIDDLNEKNLTMKEKLNVYKADSKEDWGKFKTEFKHDMDGLGKAFDDLGKDNRK